MIINCDMGEGMPYDKALMPFIDAANIACGYHAGDDDLMRQTLQYCREYGVKAGAHPSFYDPENFGRKEMELVPESIYELVKEQLIRLNAHAKEAGVTIYHVKPHGALYNMAARDIHISMAIAKAVRDHDPSLVLFGLRNSCSARAAEAMGLAFAHEIFSDRRYCPDGSLVPRSAPDALIHDEKEMILQLEQMRRLDHTDTICIHSDGPEALLFAEKIHQILKPAP